MRLASLRIAEPCPEDWETMTGDERARFCERCQLHVVNLVELRQAIARRLEEAGAEVELR